MGLVAIGAGGASARELSLDVGDRDPAFAASPFMPADFASLPDADRNAARWIATADAKSWDLQTIVARQNTASSVIDDLQGRLTLAAIAPAQLDETEGASDVSLDLVQRPAGEVPPNWTVHVPREQSQYRTFGSQVGAIKTEALLMFGYFTIRASKKLFSETEGFHFKDEGWFGKDTEYLGVDKFAHAWNTYLAAEILHNRLHRKANAPEGDALTAATLAFGFMAYNEISDAIEPDSGWSMNDIFMNGLGAGFSVLRNTVPGVKEKLAFKIEIMPNEEVWTYSGPKRFEQQRFFFALKGSGFKELRDTPLRYLDLQLGYFGSDFEPEDREAGLEPKRHLFVGVGLNVGELLFGRSHSGFGRAAYSAFDYAQIPYTSLRVDQRGDLVF